jgi:hypothetical protein
MQDGLEKKEAIGLAMMASITGTRCDRLHEWHQRHVPDDRSRDRSAHAMLLEPGAPSRLGRAGWWLGHQPAQLHGSRGRHQAQPKSRRACRGPLPAGDSATCSRRNGVPLMLWSEEMHVHGRLPRLCLMATEPDGAST